MDSFALLPLLNVPWFTLQAPLQVTAALVCSTRYGAVAAAVEVEPVEVDPVEPVEVEPLEVPVDVDPVAVDPLEVEPVDVELVPEITSKASTQIQAPPEDGF